jgi:hypothetical protein
VVTDVRDETRIDEAIGRLRARPRRGERILGRVGDVRLRVRGRDTDHRSQSQCDESKLALHGPEF